MHEVFEKVRSQGSRVESSRGSNVELSGVVLEILNPRARLSRTEIKGTPFSCLGEWLWYLSGSDDLKFIEYYIRDYGENSDDNLTVYGAYGPRVFRRANFAGVLWSLLRMPHRPFFWVRQFDNVAQLLKRKASSRQAVIQIFSGNDIIEQHKDIPCTCTLQFLVRRGQLDLITHMRSNDAYLGLPHDVFSFTMFQEMMARTIGIEIGRYAHFVGSLHIYEHNFEKVDDYIAEAWQSSTAMPPMPTGDPAKSLAWLVRTELKIRRGGRLDNSSGHDDYWMDLARLLQAYSYVKSGARDEINMLRKSMSSPIYDTYLLKRVDGATVGTNG